MLGAGFIRPVKTMRRYETWKRERADNAAWVARVDRVLGPYRRERQRDPEEAALLREIGTPEELIGPVRAPDVGAGPHPAREPQDVGAGSHPAREPPDADAGHPAPNDAPPP